MDHLQSSKSRRYICVVASILVFGYCCLLAIKSEAEFPISNETHTHWPWLADKPTGEDGFYMLTVAKNLAATYHLNYNYNMPATGIQPLATLVFGVIAILVHLLGGDQWALIRTVLIFNSALFLVFAWIMGRLAASVAPVNRRHIVFALSFLLTLFDYTIFRLFTYGLETGFYLCCLALCMVIWRRVVIADRAGWTDMLLFGVAAGFAGLSRIDFGLLFIILLAYLSLKRVASVLQILVSGLVALIIVSPWFLFVHAASGSWLPSSGKAESKLFTIHDTERIGIAALSAIAHIVPWSFAGVPTKPTTIVGLASLPLLFFWWRRAPETRLNLLGSFSDRRIFLPWAAGIAVLVCTYIIFFDPIFFYVRYLSPLAIISIPLLSLVLAEQPWIERRLFLVIFALAFFFSGWSVASIHTGHIGNPHVLSASYIQDNFPTTKVGAFQSGVIGYFNPNVENLDGKLNFGALQAAHEHRLASFIDAENINVLVDWEGYLSGLPRDYLNHEWQPCPNPLPPDDQSRCLIRKSYAATLLQ